MGYLTIMDVSGTHTRYARDYIGKGIRLVLDCSVSREADRIQHPSAELLLSSVVVEPEDFLAALLYDGSSYHSLGYHSLAYLAGDQFHEQGAIWTQARNTPCNFNASEDDINDALVSAQSIKILDLARDLAEESKGSPNNDIFLLLAYVCLQGDQDPTCQQYGITTDKIFDVLESNFGGGGGVPLPCKYVNRETFQKVLTDFAARLIQKNLIPNVTNSPDDELSKLLLQIANKARLNYEENEPGNLFVNAIVRGTKGYDNNAVCRLLKVLQIDSDTSRVGILMDAMQDAGIAFIPLSEQDLRETVSFVLRNLN